MELHKAVVQLVSIKQLIQFIMEVQVVVQHVVLEHIVQLEQEVVQVVQADIQVLREQQLKINVI